MSHEIDERLIALESRFAHQEQLCEDLSELVTEQSRQIERLTRQWQHLQDRLALLESGGGQSPQDDRPPPHY